MHEPVALREPKGSQGSSPALTPPGKFLKPGTDYVCVNQTGVQPATYKLNVTTE